MGSEGPGATRESRTNMCVCVPALSLRCARFLVTPWTVAPSILSPWDFPGKNAGAGCHFLDQTFLTQGSNLRLLYWKVDSLPPSHPGALECAKLFFFPPIVLRNLENSAVVTGLEKVSFHSSHKERQCQGMFKLPHNCTHLTR